MHTLKVASRTHHATKSPYNNNMHNPRNNVKTHPYKMHIHSCPIAVTNAAIEIKRAKDLE